MAMVAEEERRMISARTKAALAAAIRRGEQLGGFRENAKLTAKARAAGRAVLQERATARAADLADTVKELQASGVVSLRPLQQAATSAAFLQRAVGNGQRK
jgi:DNA invertase Pin-like site-specific DNA recombinase